MTYCPSCDFPCDETDGACPKCGFELPENELSRKTGCRGGPRGSRFCEQRSDPLAVCARLQPLPIIPARSLHTLKSNPGWNAALMMAIAYLLAVLLSRDTGN